MKVLIKYGVGMCQFIEVDDIDEIFLDNQRIWKKCAIIKS